MHANQLKRTMGIKRIALALVVAAFGYAGPASATLFDRGAGLIYDDVLNITWLQDANYAQTSGTDNQFFIDGLMDWAHANAWAAGLSYFDSVRNVTYTDWRLPYASVTAGAGPITTLTLGQPCSGLPAGEAACRDNEMAYMFYYNLDGTFGSPELGTQSGDGVTLNNIQPFYWSGTDGGVVLVFPFGFFGVAWVFNFNSGANSEFFQGTQLSAWAVRPGDVDGVAAAVPEPASLLLLGVGALGLALTRRRGRRR